MRDEKAAGQLAAFFMAITGAPAQAGSRRSAHQTSEI
jgi:hypothetical protein